MALITTTINVPRVLELYRKCSADVRFFIAGDVKTPDLTKFSEHLGNCRYIPPYEHNRWKISDLLGWNTIARRNIALLEALWWGAEIIVTIDDDNIPLSTDYFDRFEIALGHEFSGLMPLHNWFDPGVLLEPAARHRGYPSQYGSQLAFTWCADEIPGVAAGLCLGDPDISAVDRISRLPTVPSVIELARAGVVVPPIIWTVFNSQNTAFLRELAPCFLLCPQFGRYDDICASWITQRVMRDLSMVTHFGQPFVWQQRNKHDLIKDLEAEMWGQSHTLQFTNELANTQISEFPTVVEKVAKLYQQPIFDACKDLTAAWLEDVKSVL